MPQRPRAEHRAVRMRNPERVVRPQENSAVEDKDLAARNEAAGDNWDSMKVHLALDTLAYLSWV